MSYIDHFNTIPDDIKDLVYSKITYPQSNELLQEIKVYNIYKVVLKKIGYSNIKPTLENVSNILYNMPPIFSIYIMNVIGRMRIDTFEIDQI